MKRKLVFYSDPGHGWLEFSVAELAVLGLAGKISPYSYISTDAQHAYLEEDCDAGVVLNKLYELGERVEFVEVFQDPIFIRNLPSFPQI